MPKRRWSEASDGHQPQNQKRRDSAIVAATPGSQQNDGVQTPVNGVLHQDGPPQKPAGSPAASRYPWTPSLADMDLTRRPSTSQSRNGDGPGSNTKSEEPPQWPSITRKVKACAACRKQKIKCQMDEQGPPCRRCKERNLTCKLNKSLQTLIDDESRWKNTVSHDLGYIHAALDQALKALSLPSLPPLRTILSDKEAPSSGPVHDTSSPDEGDAAPLFDASPRLLPTEDTLGHVPIESLYEITRLRSLRSEAVEEDRPVVNGTKSPDIDDFISRGVIRLEDAERLVDFYLSRLDHFIYGLGNKYKDLNELRKGSSILTACVCAVSALHHSQDDRLYEVCNQEFRRLVSSSMFDRRINVDYLRALCIGTYWLSDISWTLSGFAVRRASDMNLRKFYYRVLDSGNRNAETPASWDPADPESSIDPVRVWYLLYICDQHLSILYARPPMIQEDDTIRGWRGYLDSPHASQSDVRISSQVALMQIIGHVRELFGIDTSEPVPKTFVSYMNTFSQQLDKWLSYWSTKLERNTSIGDFPTKGVLIHYHFGKLHLYSHVFRGLISDDNAESIPLHFKDAASSAVTHAVSILELLLNDPDLRSSIVGVPHYFHTMTAFACVVLVKVSAQYNRELTINLDFVSDLIARTIVLLRSNDCSKYHLVHWMADGLEKLLRTSRRSGAFGNDARDVADTRLFPPTHNPMTPAPGAAMPQLAPSLGDNTSFSMPPGQDFGQGPYLPMLEALEGSDYDLNSLGFNFI